MNKLFSAAAATFITFSSLSPDAAQAQSIVLHQEGEPSADLNCYLSVYPEMDLDEFYTREQAGEDLPYSYLNAERLDFAQENLPRILIDKSNGLVQIFLDTAAIEAEEFTIHRFTRPAEVVSVDAGLLSEALITIDMENDAISLQRLQSGEEFIHEIDRSQMYLKQGIGAPDVRYDFQIGGLIADIRSSVDHVKSPNFTIMLREPTDNFDEFGAHLLIGLGETGVSATFWDGIQLQEEIPYTGYNSKIHCRNIEETGLNPHHVQSFRPN